VEVSCGVLDFIDGERLVPRAMPPTLISPLEAEFFDYEALYVPGKSKDVTPAPLPADVIASIQQYAMAAHKALHCEGMSRTDMIVKNEPGAQPTILETQTIPGMTPTSLLPQQCAAVGIDFAGFVDHLIQHALFRAERRR
jgi:D-alanine-D-alanine ligase